MKVKVIKSTANYEVDLFGAKKVVKGATLAAMIRNSSIKFNFREVK